MLKKIYIQIRFWIALWGGQFFLHLYRHTGRERNDRPGMASMRLFDDFLKYVAKPKLTIVVTGTNGKTTISSVITDILRMQGMTVSFNDWGANHRAGQARCLLDAVNIFNKPIKDAAVIETDELTSPLDVPLIDPDYVIVNNLARDSMLRNAHPEHIFNQLDKAITGAKKAVVILNADDPLSCGMAKDNRRIWFGMEDQKVESPETVIDDFEVCPVCGGKPEYAFRNYRHIGDYRCPNCGFAAPKRNYFATDVDYENRTMVVHEPDGSAYTYPLISDAMHNAYNIVTVVTILRDLGIEAQEIARCLKNVHLPVSRESRTIVNGIELITHIAKGQNATASSTVFEYISKDPCDKEIIMILDEVFDNPLKSESIAWIFEADYEFLNRDNIKKIVIAGDRHLDHRLRLLLAGVPEEKIVCIRQELETSRYVDTSGIDKIYVLHDVNSITRGRKIRDAIKERILQEGGAANDN